MSHAYLALDSDISKGFHKQTKIKCCLLAVEVGAGGVRIPLCPFILMVYILWVLSCYNEKVNENEMSFDKHFDIVNVRSALIFTTFYTYVIVL